MTAIIIPGKSLGKTRTEHQRNLLKEGWSAGLSGEQFEKCKYLEKKIGKKWYKQNEIDGMK